MSRILKLNGLPVILACIMFSLLVSHNESLAFYEKFDIHNDYGSALLDVGINLVLALFMLKVVSGFQIFADYRRFIMNHFSIGMGRFINLLVYLISLFLLFLPVVLLIKPAYLVTFLGIHWLFASIFLLDIFMIKGIKEERLN